MKGTGAVVDTVDKTLFRRNLRAMRKTAPELASLLEGIEEPASRLVPQGGSWNIDLGHAMFYETDARTYAEQQLEEFTAQPIRIEFGVPERDSSPPQVLTRLKVNDFLDDLDAAGIAPEPGRLSQDGRYLVVLGVGLGHHIGRLIETYEVVNVVLVEQFVEFLWHSAHIQPWHAWLKTLKKRKGGVTVILGEDPNLVMTAMTNALRLEQGGLLDGTFIFTHYRSLLFRDLHRRIDENMIFLGSSRGFFEDECVMLYNSARNLAEREHLLWLAKPRVEKSTPVFVIVAGPSFDRCSEIVATQARNAIVISCGSGLENCLNAGIRPEFHVELENTCGQAEIIERVARRHDLSGITLIAATSVHPGVLDCFDDHILYHRDTITSSELLVEPLEVVFMSGPTVTNAGLRFALGMGFTEIYLFGVDLGTRIPSEHHSRKSAYYTDQEFMDSFPEHLAVRRWDRRQDANFGGAVHTNTDFLFARLFMYNCIKLYPSAEVFNCSDGAEIPGAIPLRPSRVALDLPPGRKAADLARLRKDLVAMVPGQGFPIQRLRALDVHMEDWIARLDRTLRKIERTRPHPFKTYEMLLELFFPRAGLDDEAQRYEAVAIQYFVGSLLSLFQGYFRFYRRVPEAEQDRLFDVFMPVFRGTFEEMAEYKRGLIAMLGAILEREDPVRRLAAE